MFGKFRFVRNAIKSKFTYNDSKDWEGEGLRSFDNEFARNVIIFGLDNNSSYDKKKNWKKILVLREGPIDGINDSTGAAKKIYY